MPIIHISTNSKNPQYAGVAEVSATNETCTSKRCLSVIDECRGTENWTQGRECHAYSGKVNAGDCAPGQSHIDGFNTYSPEFVTDNSTGCAGLSAPRYFAKCFKNEDKYPQDLDSRFNCCTGFTEQRSCDPRYCPDATVACKSVYAQYCSQPSKINEIKCERLFAADKDLYKEVVEPYCIRDNTDGRRFNEPVCQKFCAENSSSCQVKLREVCKSHTDPQDSFWAPICSCWYPSTIYDTFYKSLTEKWNVPDGVLYTSPICGFPQCKSISLAAYQPPPPTGGCKEANIVSCIQNIKVDATGAILKDSPITVAPVAACKSGYTPKSVTNCTSDAQCGTGKCVGGTCKAAAKSCTGTGQGTCSTDEKCIELECVPVATPEGNKFPVWIIILIVVVVLGGIIGFLALRKKEPKPGITLPTTKARTVKPTVKSVVSSKYIAAK